MNADEYKKVTKRAKFICKKFGLSDEQSEEAAQEVAIEYAKNKHIRIEWTVIGYLRREHGSTRTISGRIRRFAEKYAIRLDQEIQKEEGNGSTLNHDIIGSLGSSPEYIIENRLPRIPYERLRSKKEIMVLYLHMEKQLSNKQIAFIQSTTVNNVSVLLRNALSKIKAWMEYEELKEKTFLQDIKFKLK